MSEWNSQFGNHAESLAEAEATLRLVAQQPVPEGLAERVHRRLVHEQRMLASEPVRKGFWHLWLPAHRMQFAGAAALAAVIAVSTLSVRHPSPNAKGPQTPATVPAQSGGFGNTFGTSAAQAYPTTLKPIQVPGQKSKKKKPSAAHAAKRPAQNSSASEASSTPTAP